MVDPIFEYHHDIGKSITGGNVYRGKAIPELDGAYLYADYVSNKLWALWYDADKKQVIANREIPTPKPIPVMSFGEDENGETYFTTYASDGKAIFKIKPAK
jgi:quinoprotein glucose dehydrogenase